MKLSIFQISLLALFVIFVLVGVIAFAYKGGGKVQDVGQVTIWGTLDQNMVTTLIDQIHNSTKTLQNVTYVQIKESNYKDRLLNAMASGSGPDLFLVTESTLAGFANKIIPIPYKNWNKAAFESAYVDEAVLFESPNGILATPFMIDPLVMYWNKSMFATAGIAQPPTKWSEFLDLAPKITSISSGSTVNRSAVALGEWRNIVHAKEILSSLFLQTGDPITYRDQAGNLQSVLGGGGAVLPNDSADNTQTQSALLFYTEFADPAKTTYSWNRALPDSRTAFIAGQVGVYFGFASELNDIRNANPNLQFGVAMLPQISNQQIKMTYGRLSGFAISKTAQNAAGAYATALTLAGNDAQKIWAGLSNVPIVRRDVSIDVSADAAATMFAKSALIARGWLDPNPTVTNRIFQDMIESVLSGAQTPAGAVNDAAQHMKEISTGL